MPSFWTKKYATGYTRAVGFSWGKFALTLWFRWWD